MKSSIRQIALTLKALGTLIFFAPLALAAPDSEAPAAPKPHWYDKLSLRGYSQIRYNRLLETNEKLKCPQCDKSIGENGGFFIRRARIVLSGNVHDRLFVYLQPDLAGEASSTSLGFLQLRDLYFDLALDSEKEFRIRVGQSKVPFGFENLQSSQNRLPLDRGDALNSAVANERDLGLVAMWAPAPIRERFKFLVDSGLKGTGDYGVFALGAVNGQTANKPEINDNLHVVARATYPFQLANGQFIEASVQGYSGLFTVPDRTSGVKGGSTFTDRRGALSFVYYPQPFGLQAEYNFGTGPEYDSGTDSITQANLQGGYLMAMYRATVGAHTLVPFVRATYYEGGKKAELDARNYRVRDLEIGTEWSPFPAFELTAMYMVSNREASDKASSANFQAGNLLRLQAQFNY